MLVVLVLGRRLSREPGRPGFDIVASALDLVDERLHVGREAAGHEDADVKLLGGRTLLSLIKPTLESFVVRGLDDTASLASRVRQWLPDPGSIYHAISAWLALAPKTSSRNLALLTTPQTRKPRGRAAVPVLRAQLRGSRR